MRKLALSLAAVLVMSSFGPWAAAKGAKSAKGKTFSGEIMDSQCAAMGSHEKMLKKEGMAPNDPMAKKMCTEACVKMGGKYVLFNSKTKTVYDLDDQEKPKAFAGGQVKVRGTLDRKTKTIHLTDITAGT